MPDDAPSFFPTVREIMAPPAINGVTILTGGPSAFSAEEWRDYDSGRVPSCLDEVAPDLRGQEVRRALRNKDGF